MPPKAVTVTSTTPAPGGEKAVIEPSLLAKKLAELIPKWTAVTSPGSAPVTVIVTPVPPASGPPAGLTLVTVGGNT